MGKQYSVSNRLIYFNKRPLTKNTPNKIREELFKAIGEEPWYIVKDALKHIDFSGGDEPDYFDRWGADLAIEYASHQIWNNVYDSMRSENPRKAESTADNAAMKFKKKWK